MATATLCSTSSIASRQAPRHHGAPLGEAREQLPAAPRVGGYLRAVAPPQRAEHEVVRRGQAGERPAALRDVGDPAPCHLVGTQPGEVPTVEADDAAPPHGAADRAQRGGLASPVGAQ
jgi:hypothetical protein